MSITEITVQNYSQPEGTVAYPRIPRIHHLYDAEYWICAGCKGFG
ncbi:MAG: hypothetical protein ACLQVM_25885 [Terriglobia bacterium]